jgi:hypothetical protein
MERDWLTRVRRRVLCITAQALDLLQDNYDLMKRSLNPMGCEWMPFTVLIFPLVNCDKDLWADMSLRCAWLVASTRAPRELVGGELVCCGFKLGMARTLTTIFRTSDRLVPDRESQNEWKFTRA